MISPPKLLTIRRPWLDTWYTFKNQNILNQFGNSKQIFLIISLQSKQKGDKPKARLNRLKEKHSLSGLWVPRNFCKEIVVLGNKQELKVGAQQKTLL